MRAASADLANISAAPHAALGDVHAADGDKINGTLLQKTEFAFLVFLKPFFGVSEGLNRKIQFSADLGLVKPRAVIDSSNIEPNKRTDNY